MTLNEQVEQRVYDKLRAFDGMELGGNEAVSGSIASVLSEGEVLADDGNQYSSIQDAVDASEGWTFVGPGTYYENVVIDKDDFTLQGAGYDTYIDGGVVDHGITILGSNIIIDSLRVDTDSSGNGDASCISVEGVDARIYNCTFEETDWNGVDIRATGTIVDNCNFLFPAGSGNGIRDWLNSGTDANQIFKNNTIDGCGIGMFSLRDNSIVVNNTIRNGSLEGIWLSGGDSIIGGNRVHNAGDDGILLDGDSIDSICFNNRVSNSAGTDINNSGTGNTVEGNLTGGAN